jgi:hypothetical protein
VCVRVFFATEDVIVLYVVPLFGMYRFVATTKCKSACPLDDFMPDIHLNATLYSFVLAWFEGILLRRARAVNWKQCNQLEVSGCRRVRGLDG